MPKHGGKDNAAHFTRSSSSLSCRPHPAPASPAFPLLFLSPLPLHLRYPRTPSLPLHLDNLHEQVLVADGDPTCDGLHRDFKICRHQQIMQSVNQRCGCGVDDREVAAVRERGGEGGRGGFAMQGTMMILVVRLATMRVL